MTKQITIAALVVAGSTMMAGNAYAQETKPLGLSVRAGFFLPTNRAAKNAGENWLSFGLEYKIGDLKFGPTNPGYVNSYSISVDYYNKGDFRNVPVMLNYIGRGETIYYFAGAGVGFSRLTIGTNVLNSTDFAYQMGIGYEIMRGKTPIFFEAKYVGSGESRLAGWGLFVGTRF